MAFSDFVVTLASRDSRAMLEVVVLSRSLVCDLRLSWRENTVPKALF